METNKTSEVNLPTLETEGDLHEEVTRVIERLLNEITPDNPCAKYMKRLSDMYHFFKECHQKNVKLLEKCNEKSASILINASKINAILNTTKNDKKNMSELKEEYEKVSSMIKTSNDLEIKSKKIINTLKNSVTQLNNQINRGEVFSFGDENNIMHISREIKNLKEEYQRSNDEKRDLEAQIEDHALKTSKIKNQIKKLKGDEEELNKFVKFYSEQLNNISDTVVDSSESILTLKPLIKKGRGEIDNILKNKSIQLAKVDKLKEKYHEVITALSRVKDDSRAIRDRTNLKAKYMSETINKIKLKLSEKDRLNTKLNDIKECMRDCDDKLSEIDEISKNYTSQLHDVISNSKKIENEKNDVRKECRSNRSKLVDLSFELAKKLNEKNQDQRKVNAFQLSLQVDRKLVSEETERTTDNIGQTRIVKSEIVAEKEFHQEMKEKILTLFNEIDKEKASISQIEMKTKISEDCTKYTEKQIENLIGELSVYKQKTFIQDQLIDEIGRERNISKRQLVALEKENDDIKNDIIRLNDELEENSSLERKLNRDIVDTHEKRRICSLVCTNLSDGSGNLREGIFALERVISRLCAEVQTLNHIINEAKHDKTQQKNEMSLLASNIEITRRAIYERNAKIQNIRSELMILENNKRECQKAYKTMCEDMLNATDELDAMNKKSEKLEIKRDHLKQLQFEYHRYSTELLFEKQKYSALVYEFSVLRNVHRWEVIGAVDPFYATNLRYRAEITRKIDLAHEKLMRLRNQRDDLIKSISEYKNKLEKTPTKEEAAKLIQAYSSSIRKKEKYMRDIRLSIEGNVPNISNSITKLENIKSKVNRKRMVTATIKNRSILVSTELKMKEKQQSTSDEDQWFITESSVHVPNILGGGYVVRTPNLRPVTSFAGLVVNKEHRKLNTLRRKPNQVISRKTPSQISHKLTRIDSSTTKDKAHRVF